VAVIEAMKVLNEIKAEKIGIIKKILVDDAHPVEYMQPIYEIEAS
jgi:acetyl-CoA carboxylase biotin carboxyl carrier protein